MDLGDGATALVRAIEVADDEVEGAEKVAWGDRFVHGLVAGAVTDLIGAADAFEAAGDFVRRAEARLALRDMRSADAISFDSAWPGDRVLPVWLAHPESVEGLADEFVAWIQRPDWAASETFLHAHAGTLLTDTGEAVMEHLADANPTP